MSTQIVIRFGSCEVRRLACDKAEQQVDNNWRRWKVSMLTRLQSTRVVDNARLGRNQSESSIVSRDPR